MLGIKHHAMEQQVSFDDISVAFQYRSDRALQKAYLIFAAMNNNLLVSTGTSAIKTALGLKLPVTGLIKHTIFGHFCGGETIEECEATVNMLGSYGVGTILDYSVEGEKTEANFDKTKQEIIRTILKAKTSPSIPFCVFKVTGIAQFALLEKVQSGAELSEEDKKAYQRVVERVDSICKAACENGVPIFIDGEESWIQNSIDNLAYSMMARYNKEKAIVYNTYQMYRWDMLEKLKSAHQQASLQGFFLGAKLVRGAYMEKESERAAEMGYMNPIQPSKEATDRDYNAAQKFCIEHLDRIGLCSGSHNEHSNYSLMELMEEHGISHNDKRVYFAQLFGMSDNISFNLAQAGYNVAKYVPYGPVKSVMPYLFRRAEENTSIAGQSSREYLLVKAEMKRRKTIKK
jgi:proline dehydrogenase